MATALAAGFLDKKICVPTAISAFDIQPETLEAFKQKTGGETSPDAKSLVQHSDVVICAVKPQHMAGALSSIAGDLNKKLFISIAAGIPLKKLREMNPAITRWVRVMPNTPALVGESASAFCVADPGDADARNITRGLFSAVGLCVELEEKYFDVVTGLSGSGPAFVYLFIEALADAGVRGGLPRPEALRLAAQTVLGAAKMVLSTAEHPAVLRDNVTSPGGTTVEGLSALHEAGFVTAIHRAVRAAENRSKELASQ